MERMLEQAVILLRRPDKDGDLVERHATARLLENPPRDLDRLAPFAWRREET